MASFCSLDDLIKLKTKAARPRDLEDISQLAKLRTMEGEK
jgi:predicted nucleotidyltransferase